MGEEQCVFTEVLLLIRKDQRVGDDLRSPSATDLRREKPTDPAREHYGYIFSYRIISSRSTDVSDGVDLSHRIISSRWISDSTRSLEGRNEFRKVTVFPQCYIPLKKKK